MPEYVAPGVYVEEVNTGAHSIPGVSTPIDSVRLQSLVAELKKVVASQFPAWTDSNEADPGVTLLELFAWLTENLLYGVRDIPERGRVAALRAASALLARGSPRAATGAPLTRPSFFGGQLLDAATLQAEQDYHRDKLRRHNRRLHGFGIVSGLGVHVEPTSDPRGWRIIVDPGYAIDGCGEEIAVCTGVALVPPSDRNETFVSLRFWEHACLSSSPATSGEEDGVMGVGQATAVEEACVIGVGQATGVEEACVIGVGQAVLPPALTLARLIRADGVWRVDPTFVALRAG